MICDKCGADSGEADLCRRCAERLWVDSCELAVAQAKVLWPLVVANTRGAGDAVLSLLIIAQSIHMTTPGLFPFDFYVDAATRAHGLPE